MLNKLLLLLIVPVAVSFYLSIERDVFWLCSSVIALVIILYASAGIIGRVSNRIARRILSFSLIFSLTVFELSRLVSYYFQGESFNERFFFHFNLNSITEAGNAYLPAMIVVVIYLSIIAIIGWLWFDTSHQNRNFPVPVQALFLGFALFILEPDVSKLTAQKINALLNENDRVGVDQIAWYELELNQNALLADFGSAYSGKNLLLIYLESLEEIYTDERIFPGLTPHLNILKQSGLTFRQMQQTEGTGWTIAGMVASQCGTPLLYSYGSDGNSILHTGFLNQTSCLGDILKRAGYYQVYLGGASTKFAGKGNFLTSHGYDEVLGNTELSAQLEDDTYQSGWGLYDDSLFAIAEEKFKSLAQTQKPFNLTLLTLDTHHPNGHASRSCAKYRYFENTMLDAVHCTDSLLNQFLESIRQHPAWENTLVVLFSDHLAMRNVAQKYYPAEYKRKLLFVILNAETMGEIEIPGTHMDVAPTVLHLMNVQHKREFLAGRNLITADQGTSNDVLFSQLRLDTLRYINSHLLTGMGNDACSGDFLIAIQDNVIKIGNHTVTMQLAGNQVTPESLELTQGLLVAIDNQGRVGGTVTFNLENLSHVIYQYDEDPFLLIARNDFLPQHLMLSSKRHEGVGVFWKNAHGKIQHLGTSDNSSQIRIKHPGCSNLFPEIKQNKEENINMLALQDICRANSRESDYIDRETGNIHLARVAHENVWYQAQLSRIDANRYSINDLVLLGEIIPDPESDNCHAYFGNSELIIPALKSENQIFAVKMQLIPQLDGQFRVIKQENWQ